MKKFNIVARSDTKSNEYAKQLKEKCIINGMIHDEIDPEVVIVVGGDGSVLYAMSQYMHKIEDIVFVGVKTGTLGFFCDYTENEFDLLIDDILNNHLIVNHYPLLQAKCDGYRQIFYALNEIRIEDIVATMDMDVFINNQLFEHYRGTGMCVSTQLGSSAYNRSLGGALLQEGLELMQMTQIAGIHHSQYRSLQSPLILGKKSTIRFVSDGFAQARMGVDVLSFPLLKSKEIEITYSSRYVQLVRRVTYLNRLKVLF